jgi:putative membrane protein
MAGPGDSAAPADGAGRSLYGQPFSWLVFGWLLFLVPIAGYLWQTSTDWHRLHPALNALLNASSALFLVAGRIAIARKNKLMHAQCMVAAVIASTVFLASYLARFAMTGAHRYPGDGWDKAVYLVILMSHMVLAAALVPLAARAFYLALRRRFARHRRVARYTWPIWIYVSVTGVVVYLMLYPVAEAVYGSP